MLFDLVQSFWKYEIKLNSHFVKRIYDNILYHESLFPKSIEFQKTIKFEKWNSVVHIVWNQKKSRDDISL